MSATGATRRPGPVRRTLRALSTASIVVGALLLLDAGLTLAWQEPLTALYTRIVQNRLDDDLRALERKPLSGAERRALALLPSERRRVEFLARALRRRVKTGQAIGRIKIRKIHINFVVVEGTDTASLRKGPGHYPETPMPGMHGTVAIAGHRTTYLAPFRHLDRVNPTNLIDVEMPYARFVYRVQQRRIVQPTDVWVLRRKSYDRLVLSACHPLYSAAQRIIIFARLIRVERLHARPAAARPGGGAGFPWGWAAAAAAALGVLLMAVGATARRRRRRTP